MNCDNCTMTCQTEEESQAMCNECMKEYIATHQQSDLDKSDFQK